MNTPFRRSKPRVCDNAQIRPCLDQLPGCEAYFGNHFQHRGGYSFYRDARLHGSPATAITTCPWTPAAATFTCATTSRAVLVALLQPTRHAVEDYSVRHGMGYHHRLLVQRHRAHTATSSPR